MRIDSLASRIIESSKDYNIVRLSYNLRKIACWLILLSAFCYFMGIELAENAGIMISEPDKRDSIIQGAFYLSLALMGIRYLLHNFVIKNELLKLQSDQRMLLLYLIEVITLVTSVALLIVSVAVTLGIIQYGSISKCTLILCLITFLYITLDYISFSYERFKREWELFHRLGAGYYDSNGEELFDGDRIVSEGIAYEVFRNKEGWFLRKTGKRIITDSDRESLESFNEKTKGNYRRIKN